MDKKAISLIVSAMFAIPLAAWSEDDAAPTAVAKGGSSLQIFGRAYAQYSFGQQPWPARQRCWRTRRRAHKPRPVSSARQRDWLPWPGEPRQRHIRMVPMRQGTMAFLRRGAGTGAGAAGIRSPTAQSASKGAFGNAYAGNWDTPLKKTCGGCARREFDWHLGREPHIVWQLSHHGTTTRNRQPGPVARTIRFFTITPVKISNGIQVFTAMSTPSTSVGVTSNQSGGKPRLYLIAANYSNGQSLVTAGDEYTRISSRASRSTATIAALIPGTSWAPGMRSDRRESASFTPNRNWIRRRNRRQCIRMGHWFRMDRVLSGTTARRLSPCEQVRLGNFVAGPGATLLPQSDNRVFNGGRGDYAGSLWQIRNVVRLQTNRSDSRIRCGQERCERPVSPVWITAAPASGQNQSAFGISIKNTF